MWTYPRCFRKGLGNMTVNRIELMTMAPKSWETSMQHVTSKQRQEFMNAQLAAEYGKDLKHESEQTLKSVKTENNEFRYDNKESGHNGAFYQKNPRKRKKEDSKEETKQSNQGHSLDIRI